MTVNATEKTRREREIFSFLFFFSSSLEENERATSRRRRRRKKVHLQAKGEGKVNRSFTRLKNGENFFFPSDELENLCKLRNDFYFEKEKEIPSNIYLPSPPKAPPIPPTISSIFPPAPSIIPLTSVTID